MISWFHLNFSILFIIYCILDSITFIITFHYVGIEPDEQIEAQDDPYEVDQPTKEHDVTYQVSRITGSCSCLERGGIFSKSLDASKWEELRKPRPDGIFRKHISELIWLYFDKHLVVTQA